MSKQTRYGRVLKVIKIFAMGRNNRDILVLFNQDLMTAQSLEREVSLLHEILFDVERLDNLVTAHELLDLNKYKVITKSLHIRDFLRGRKDAPFVFLNNKN
jgi:hypothetical protein